MCTLFTLYKKMKSSFLPCTIVFWAVAVVFISSYLYIFYDKYTENYCEAVETQESLKKVYTKTCLDLSQKELLTRAKAITDDYCIGVEHTLHKDPNRIAVVNTIGQMFGVCTTDSCKATLGNIAYFIQVIAITIIAIIFLLAACGCQLMRKARVNFTESGLPEGVVVALTNTPIPDRRNTTFHRPSNLYNDTSKTK